MNSTVGAASVISLALLAGCAPDAVRPDGVTLENNPFVKLPRAQAMLMGGSVMISTVVDVSTDAAEGFEGLRDGSGYHAWARSGGATTSIGAFTPGVDLEADLAGGADEVLITVEEGTPSAPSSTVVVSGPADGALAFGALDAVSFSGARATAYRGDGWLELDYQGLPDLPEGYRYELWLTPMDDEHQPIGEPISAAGLDTPPMGTTARYQDEALPELFDLHVAVEVVGGRAAMSPTQCLQVPHSHDEHAHGGHEH